MNAHDWLSQGNNAFIAQDKSFVTIGFVYMNIEWMCGDSALIVLGHNLWLHCSRSTQNYIVTFN